MPLRLRQEIQELPRQRTLTDIDKCEAAHRLVRRFVVLCLGSPIVDAEHRCDKRYALAEGYENARVYLPARVDDESRHKYRRPDGGEHAADKVLKSRVFSFHGPLF